MGADDWIDGVPRLDIWARFPLGLAVTAGVLFVAFGAIALCVVPTAVLTCERQDSQVPGCDITWSVFFDRITVRRAAVRELKAVEREELTGTPSRAGARIEPNYQLTIRTEAGAHRLNLLGEYAPMEAARQQIAAFLANGNERALYVTIGPTGPFLWIRRVGAGIVVLGLGVLSSVPLRLAVKLFP